MNRVVLMITGAVALMAVAFFAFKDQVVTSSAGSNTGNIKMTEVVLNLNCPVDQSVLLSLIEVYGDNSCPRITIKRLDLRNNNQISIEPRFSWLTTFKSSFFPLVKEDLEGDINGFRNTVLTQDVQRLLTTAQGAGADCYYNSLQVNYTFKSTQMNSNNLTAYVNKEVAQGKSKVVFKVLKCTPMTKSVITKPQLRTTTIEKTESKQPEKKKVEVVEEKTKKRIDFTYSESSNSIQWDATNIQNLTNKTFVFEFQFKRGSNLIKSGPINFAVSNLEKKVISTKEIIDAGGDEFINHCHGKTCQLFIFQNGKKYQEITVSNVDCNNFHR